MRGPTTRVPGFLGLVGCLALLLASCAPAGPGSGRAGQQLPDAPKTLRMGILNEEPTDGIALFGGTSTGALEPTYTFHAGLTIFDPKGVLLPHIAHKAPAIEDGDWQLFPDGRMEVTWKLRTDVKWHDGTPLSAEDFVLGTQIAMDPDVPISRARGIRYISEVLAPDAHTFVVRYRTIFSEANVSGPTDLPAVPRHLMAQPYASGEKQAFANHPYWTREFMGLGPYRLGEWALGSHIEALAFDQYFLGRPKIDRVILRYYTDVNTLVANLLAGEVDLIPGGSLKIEQAVAIKSQWDPAAGGTVVPILNKFRQIELQYRDPSAPWARDVRVRQALVHLTDRQAIVDTLLAGFTTPADAPLLRDDPTYHLLEERGLAKYPYEPARAERLLADAGWSRGADGVRQAAGERLVIEVAATGSSSNSSEARESLVIADQWKAGGLAATSVFIAEDLSNLSEVRAKVLGGLLRSISMEPSAQFESMATAEIASETNRWRGRNRGGYSNPALDQLFRQYTNALEVASRQALVADMAKLAADEAIFIAVYYGFDIFAFRKGVSGLTNTPAVQRVNAWNIQTWQIG